MNIEVLKFSANWCGPCRTLSTILKGVEGITEVNVDQNRDLAAEYNVRRVPLLVFKVDGKEVYRHSGSITRNRYEQLIEEIETSKELNNN